MKAPLYEDTSGDRKSTRLNSSHGYISYAVFCLKKTTTTNTHQRTRTARPLRGATPAPRRPPRTERPPSSPPPSRAGASPSLLFFFFFLSPPPPPFPPPPPPPPSAPR